MSGDELPDGLMSRTNLPLIFVPWLIVMVSSLALHANSSRSFCQSSSLSRVGIVLRSVLVRRGEPLEVLSWIIASHAVWLLPMAFGRRLLCPSRRPFVRFFVSI